jgi:cytoskeletal protein RodZ
MAKTESTAVNQLIEMVATSKPLPPDPSDDLMFREPPRRTPSGTGVPVNPRSLGGPTLMGPAGPSTLPPLPPVQPVSPPPQNQTLMGIGLSPEELIKTTKMSGPPEAMQALPLSSPIISGSIDPREIPPPELPPVAFTTQPHVMPVAAPFGEAPAQPGWYPDQQHARPQSVNEQFTNTQRLKRAQDWKRLAGKLIAPMIGLVILGVFVGGYFAFDGEGGKPRTPKAKAAAKKEITVIPQPSPTPAAAPAPAPAPAEAAATPTASAPTPASTAAAAASTPAPAASAPAPAPAAPVTAPAAVAPAAVAPAAVGATPALVDVRIDSKPAGATVMLVDRGKTTFLGTTPISTSLDPSREYDLVFTASGFPTRLEHLDARGTKHVAVDLKKRRSTSTAPTTPAASASGSGTGTLMISTKPPCEIIVDGKPTGLVTPQRAITLPVGTHKVTLVNTGENIKKTIAVEITADQATRVIQDLMQ